MKTNLTKFAAICVKKGLKGKFLEPKKLQNHSNEKQKERRKKERLEGKEEKKKKNNGRTLSFYNSYFGDSYFGPSGDKVIKKGVDIVLTQ